MRSIKISLFLFLMVLTFVPRAWAQDTTEKPENSIPDGAIISKALQDQIDQGAEVHYIGSAYALDGWLIRRDDRVTYVYTTPDGEAYIVGVLMDSEGQSLTSAQVKLFLEAKKEGRVLPYQQAQTKQPAKMVPPPDVPAPESEPAPEPEEVAETPPEPEPTVERLSPEDAQKTAQQLLAEIDQANREKKEPETPVDAMYEAVESANWISIGSSRAPYIYAFVDPDCEDCHVYWEKIKPYIKDDMVQLRVLPVALTKQGRKKAAALFAARQPQRIWRVLMGDEKGDVPHVADDSPHIDEVNHNIALMYEWNFNGIPYSIYKDSADVIKIIYDTPDNIMVVMSEIAF